MELESHVKELQETEHGATKTMTKCQAIQEEMNNAKQEAKQAEMAAREMARKLDKENRQLHELEKQIKELELKRRIRQDKIDALEDDIQKEKAKQLSKRPRRNKRGPRDMYI